MRTLIRSTFFTPVFIDIKAMGDNGNNKALLLQKSIEAWKNNFGPPGYLIMPNKIHLDRLAKEVFYPQEKKCFRHNKTEIILRGIGHAIEKVPEEVTLEEQEHFNNMAGVVVENVDSLNVSNNSLFGDHGTIPAPTTVGPVDDDFDIFFGHMLNGPEVVEGGGATSSSSSNNNNSIRELDLTLEIGTLKERIASLEADLDKKNEDNNLLKMLIREGNQKLKDNKQQAEDREKAMEAAFEAQLASRRKDDEAAFEVKLLTREKEMALQLTARDQLMKDSMTNLEAAFEERLVSREKDLEAAFEERLASREKDLEAAFEERLTSREQDLEAAHEKDDEVYDAVTVDEADDAVTQEFEERLASREKDLEAAFEERLASREKDLEAEFAAKMARREKDMEDSLWMKIKSIVDKENVPSSNKRKRQDDDAEDEEVHKKPKIESDDLLFTFNRLAHTSIIAQESSKPFRKKINALFDKYKDTRKFLRKVREILETVEAQKGEEVVGKQATITRMYVDKIVSGDMQQA